MTMWYIPHIHSTWYIPSGCHRSMIRILSKRLFYARIMLFQDSQGLALRLRILDLQTKVT